jgi:hypothetical protein
MRAWPTKNATRLGTAIRLARIITDEYSELTQSTQSTAMASQATANPSRLTPIGSQLSFSETLNLA